MKNKIIKLISIVLLLTFLPSSLCLGEVGVVRENLAPKAAVERLVKAGLPEDTSDGTPQYKYLLKVLAISFAAFIFASSVWLPYAISHPFNIIHMHLHMLFGLKKEIIINPEYSQAAWLLLKLPWVKVGDPAVWDDINAIDDFGGVLPFESQEMYFLVGLILILPTIVDLLLYTGLVRLANKVKTVVLKDFIQGIAVAGILHIVVEVIRDFVSIASGDSGLGCLGIAAGIFMNNPPGGELAPLVMIALFGFIVAINTGINNIISGAVLLYNRLFKKNKPAQKIKGSRLTRRAFIAIPIIYIILFTILVPSGRKILLVILPRSLSIWLAVQFLKYDPDIDNQDFITVLLHKRGWPAYAADDDELFHVLTSRYHGITAEKDNSVLGSRLNNQALTALKGMVKNPALKQRIEVFCYDNNLDYRTLQARSTWGPTGARIVPEPPPGKSIVVEGPMRMEGERSP